MIEQAFIEQQGKCDRCSSTQNLTIDHIVPRSLLLDMGFEPDGKDFDEDNLTCLCKRCNQFKSNHLDFSNPKTKPLLIKYVNKIE